MTFPWPVFIQEMSFNYALEPTNLPILQTLHVANTLGGNRQEVRDRGKQPTADVTTSYEGLYC